MKLMRCLPVFFILVSSYVLLADDPKPTPTPVVPNVLPIPATNRLLPEKEVSGTGTRTDPYIFTKSTRSLLRLSVSDESVLKDVEWDLEDAPTDALVLDKKYILWSLFKEGDFQVISHGPSVYCKVWIRIKTGTDPPGPTPTPTPTPTPIPTPVDPNETGKLWVVIVEEADNLTTIPSEILVAKSSSKVANYCKTHCVLDQKGNPEFKTYDDDQDIANSSESLEIKDAFAKAVKARQEAKMDGIWLILSNGKTGWSGPLPNEAKTLEILQQYGGK